MSSIPHRGDHEVYIMQLPVIMFVYDFQQITWFSTVSSTNKPDLHDITEILTEEAASSVHVLYFSWSFGGKLCVVFNFL